MILISKMLLYLSLVTTTYAVLSLKYETMVKPTSRGRKPSKNCIVDKRSLSFEKIDHYFHDTRPMKTLGMEPLQQCKNQLLAGSFLSVIESPITYVLIKSEKKEERKMKNKRTMEKIIWRVVCLGVMAT